jgi:hypothetical protein
VELDTGIRLGFSDWRKNDGQISEYHDLKQEERVRASSAVSYIEVTSEEDRESILTSWVASLQVA